MMPAVRGWAWQPAPIAAWDAGASLLAIMSFGPLFRWWQVTVDKAFLHACSCKLRASRYNGAARRLAGVVMVVLPVPPQRAAVNPVRPGREQP